MKRLLIEAIRLTSRFCIALILTALTLAVGAPAHAWLYDGEGPYISGAQVQDGTTTEWVSQGFVLPTDSMVTSFGAAIARGFGGSQTGFNIYLSDQRYGLSVPTMASGKILPLGVGYTYVYASLANPVLLHGGQKYYLTLLPNSNNFVGSISWSYKQGADFGIKSGNEGQAWSQCSSSLAVRLDGYAVPEAQTWTAMVIGMMGCAALAWSRRRYGSRAGVDQA